MPRAFLDFCSCIILAKSEVKFKKEISGQQISPFSMESISRLIQRGNCLGKLENITVSHSDLNPVIYAGGSYFMSGSLVHSAKFQRGHARCFFEHGNKMTGVGETGHAGDVLYF